MRFFIFLRAPQGNFLNKGAHTCRGNSRALCGVFFDISEPAIHLKMRKVERDEKRDSQTPKNTGQRPKAAAFGTLPLSFLKKTFSKPFLKKTNLWD